VRVEPQGEPHGHEIFLTRVLTCVIAALSLSSATGYVICPEYTQLCGATGDHGPRFGSPGCLFPGVMRHGRCVTWCCGSWWIARSCTVLQWCDDVAMRFSC